MKLPRQRKKITATVVMTMTVGLILQWRVSQFIDMKERVNFWKRLPLVRRIFSLTDEAPMKLFEPEVTEDIQTVAAELPRIPHILHFIFITDVEGKSGIPAIYKYNVESFVHFNPEWAYYFWTKETSRELIASKHPELLSTWDSYKLVVNKADALRYVLLYEFGGVYSDLDIGCRRSLDRATMKYACILTPEPFEHSALLFRTPFVMSNAFMMCRPKHPIMKQALFSLPKFANHPSMLGVAGPIFLTVQFKRYNKFKYGDAFRTKLYNQSNSPYFYQGTLPEEHEDAVYVANTHYFMSSFDMFANYSKACLDTDSNKTPLVKRGCYLLKSRRKSDSQFSFIDHQWRHLYAIKRSTQMVPINDVIPVGKLKT